MVSYLIGCRYSNHGFHCRKPMRQFLNRKSVTHEITSMSAKQNSSHCSVHQGPGLRPTRYLTVRSSIRAPTGDRIARERRVIESSGQSASQTRAVLSAKAVTIRLPSGLNGMASPQPRDAVGIELRIGTQD